MIAAYQGEETAVWLRQFNRDFNYFINKMKLQAFVNDNYDVLDISTGQTEIIQDFISRKEISETLNYYMENMLKLIVKANLAERSTHDTARNVESIQEN